jgi:predicted nucleotidyltransferase
MHGYEKLLRLLLENEVEFILIGGFAAVVHGCTVLTQDVDICISFDEDNMRKLLTALEGHNPRFRENKEPVGKSAIELSRMKNLYLITDIGSLDLLGEVAGLGGYKAVLDNSISIDLFGKNCRVLDIDSLIRSKKGMGRAKDKEAVVQLLAIKEKSE